MSPTPPIAGTGSAVPLRGSVPSSPHSPGLTASGSRARLPGEPPASGSVLSLPSRDCVSDLKLPEGGTNCRGTASLGGRGPQVTGNPDETQMRAPASAVVSGSPAVGQEAAARDSNVPVHTRASRPRPPRGPRRRVFSFLRIHGRCPGVACSKAIRTGTDQEAQDQDRVPMDRLDLEVCPGRVRAQTMEQGRGEGGRSLRKQSQHRRAGRGQDPSQARTGALTVGWQRPAV